jgi:hypothetical protein
VRVPLQPTHKAWAELSSGKHVVAFAAKEFYYYPNSHGTQNVTQEKPFKNDDIL